MLEGIGQTYPQQTNKSPQGQYNMASCDQAITLTPLDTNKAAFTVSSTDLITVLGINTNDSSVKYAINNRTTSIIQVNESPSALSSSSLTLIAVTLFSNGDTIYLNAARIKSVITDNNVDNSTGCVITINTEAAAWDTYTVTETQAAVAVLINAIADIVPIPLAQHITATTQSTSTSTGALVVDGGVGIAKAVYVGGVLNAEIGVNLATASGVTTIGAATPVTVSAAGVLTVAKTTDSTTKDTGAVIIEGGVGVEKSIFAGLTVNAGTTLSVGTNQTFAKEVDHTVTVTTTTTAATAGGALDIVSGAGATSGAGGEASIKSGAGGVTGAGGVLNAVSGAGGATSGASGAVNIASGAATIGSSGTVTIASGNTASGVAGDIQLTPGTHTSTTVTPVISLNKATIRKPSTKSAATGATLTGVELLGGYISVTGGTGNLTLPDAADITTAIGSTPAGTWFDFVVNATNMTATNVVTLVAGANTTAMKQTSAGDSASSQLLTVTQTAGTEVGIFRLTYITATTCSLHRVG